MSLEDIEDFLSIDFGDKILCNGKCKDNKNQYYYIRGECYVVNLSKKNDIWMIADDSKETRKMLRDHIYHYSNGYARNSDLCGWHRILLDCDDDNIVDHINRKTFDNRISNLREVTHNINSRNKTTYANNTSGKQGVALINQKKYKYWKVSIKDNNNKSKQVVYSINKFGNAKAKRLAIKKRKELETQYGYIGE